MTIKSSSFNPVYNTNPNTNNLLVELASGNVSIDAANLATESTLQQVRDAIKAQIDIASTIWTDNTGTYYIRRDLVNEGTGTITVSFTLPDGTTTTPSIGLRPLSTVDKDVLSDYYDVITSGTGYTIGDLLARVAIIDVNGSSPTSTFIWLNLTSGTVLSPNPNSAHIERSNESVGSKQAGIWDISINNFPSSQLVSVNSLPLPTTASTSVLQTNGNTILNSIDAKLPLTLGSKTSATSLSTTSATDDPVRTKATLAIAAPTTSVGSSITSVTLLNSNASRKWASFRNDSTSIVYIAKSSTASTSSVHMLQSQGFLSFDDYSGVVSAIWINANGFMRIEEGT